MISCVFATLLHNHVYFTFLLAIFKCRHVLFLVFQATIAFSLQYKNQLHLALLPLLCIHHSKYQVCIHFCHTLLLHDNVV